MGLEKIHVAVEIVIADPTPIPAHYLPIFAEGDAANHASSRKVPS